MIDFLNAQIQNGQTKWFTERMPAIQWTIYSNSFDNMHDNVLFFGIPNGHTEPRLVAKVCRHPDYAGTLHNEYEKLETTWNQFGEEAEKNLPRPLGIWRRGLDQVLLLSYCPGSTIAVQLPTLFADGEIKPIFQNAAHWLGNLHQTMMTDQRQQEPASEFTMRAQIFRQIFHLTGDEELCLQEVTEKMAICGQGIPNVTLLQGDFWPGNCLYDPQEKRIRVVDWQYSRWGHDVNLDVYLFLIASARSLSKREDPKDWGLETARTLNSWRNEQIPAFLKVYHENAQIAGKLGLLPAQWGLLAVCVEMGARPYLSFDKLQEDSMFWRVLFAELAHAPHGKHRGG